VYSEPGDGNFNGERHGTAVQAGHRSPVCYITISFQLENGTSQSYKYNVTLIGSHIRSFNGTNGGDLGMTFTFLSALLVVFCER